MRLSTTIALLAGGQGSGCQGPNCGRPKETLYHGTTESRAKGIVEKGLRTKKDIPTVTTKREEAEKAARLVAEENGGRPVVVTLKDSANKFFDNGDLGSEYGVSTYRNASVRNVAPKHIDKVERV